MKIESEFQLTFLIWHIHLKGQVLKDDVRIPDVFMRIVGHFNGI